MCCDERNTQRRTTSSSCIFRRALRARRSRVTFLSVICYALLLLGFFTTDDFVRVAHTFAFVRLWWTEVADLSGHLTYQLLINTLDQDIGLARGLSGDAFRQFVIHWVREAKGQVQNRAFCLRFVTNTDQLELTLEALAYALDHVVYQRTRGTGHCASLLIAIRSEPCLLLALCNQHRPAGAYARSLGLRLGPCCLPTHEWYRPLREFVDRHCEQRNAAHQLLQRSQRTNGCSVREYPWHPSPKAVGLRILLRHRLAA